MTGNQNLLSSIIFKDGGTVTFGDNNKGQVIGIGMVGNISKPLIENVLLVKGLKYNLLSISQLCDKNYKIVFEKEHCMIYDIDMTSLLFKGVRKKNIYILSMNFSSYDHCLLVSSDDSLLWHRRCGHVNMRNLSRVSKNDLVNGLPRLEYKKDHFCDSCQKGKMHKTSFKFKDIISTKRPLELLHIDLFGPSRISSLNNSRYALVIVDDYSRFTWTLFLRNKDDAFGKFTDLCKLIQNQKATSIVTIRSDHGGEFENELFSDFCSKNGIKHEFSVPRTPQQNGVVERKNRTLQECARTLLCESNLPKSFWAEAVSCACYILNRILLRPILNKTPFELFHDRIPKISYFRVFGCKCFILNTKDQLDKFDSKSDEGIFVGYSLRSKAYRVFNKRTSVIEESLNVTFDETLSKNPVISLDDEIIDPLVDEIEEISIKENGNILPKDFVEVRNHPHRDVIGNISDNVRTRSHFNLFTYIAFTSTFEPKNIKEALLDNSWINAMHDELNQFVRNKVWTLVPRPLDQSVVGTKWIFRNKLDENGNVVRNKARLVAQGYSQEEGIDYDETYAPVARLESIRLLLAFACYMGFKLFQMDVKSAFLNGFIKEEVFVEQPPGFENDQFPNHVYKLDKALYGLKQAPRAWYERLRNFLLTSDFVVGKVDSTLFIKKIEEDILVVQIYVDDIIFGSSNEELCQIFAKDMQQEFEMSHMGELTYFLGFQIRQLDDGTFINQSKYAKEILKRFGMDNTSSKRTPIGTTTSLDKDESGKCVDQKTYRAMIGSLLYLTASRPDIMFSVCICARFQSNPKESHMKAVKRILRYLKDTTNYGLFYSKSSSLDFISYSDADFAGCKTDRKSTSGTCHFLGHSLISWCSKKQNSVSLSTTEAEYIAASLACAQVLWMKQTLLDYNIKFSSSQIFCDNTSAINLSKNPVHHSRTKHIDVRHHFLRDHVLKGDITLEFISTENQIADILTKPLKEDSFVKLRRELGICDISNII